MSNLSKNKGIVFIVTLMVMAVVFAVAGAYVSNAIVQNQSVVREVASAQQFYSSEKGMEYAYIESKNHNFNWFTHIVSADSSLVKNNTTPTVTISGASINPTTGCYEITLGSGKLEIKTYADPNRPSETLVLSRYTLNSVCHIEKMRISNKSLFTFFYYYPTDKYFGGMTLDGKSIAGIYVKGNISMHSTTFKNLTELSTDPAHGIVKYYYQYNAPYSLDDNSDSVRDGKAALPSLYIQHDYSSLKPYPWGTSYWPYCPAPTTWPPYDWKNISYHFYYEPSGNYITQVGSVNGVTLPVTLPTPWNWDKYSGTDKSAKPGGKDEKDVQFYDSSGNLADSTYWNNLYSWLIADGTNAYTPGTAGPCYGSASWTPTVRAACAASYFDSAFWANKVYKRDSETVPVNYLNTNTTNGQAADFDTWMRTPAIPDRSPLINVIKKYDLVFSPTITNGYIAKAKSAGLYIGRKTVCSGGSFATAKNSSPLKVILEAILNLFVPQAYAVAAPGGGGSCVTTYDVWLNGVNSSTLPVWITDNVTFFNTVYPHMSGSTPTTENVMQLDISALLSHPELTPSNGIIYINTYYSTTDPGKSIRIVNGSQLPSSPSRGLTIVCPHNIYIKGDYNLDANWQPAAIISDNIVYILSDNFVDRSDLPKPLYPREYPNELQVSYLDVANNFVPGDGVKLTTLENNCKIFFGLSPGFDIHSTSPVNKQPADKVALQTAIRNQYNQDYQSLMPNKAKSTTINAAIASYYDIGSYQLERWYQESWHTGTALFSTGSPTINLKGAFIRFGTQWSSPVVNDTRSAQTYIVRAGDTNKSPNPMQHGTTLTNGVTPIFAYEDRFGDPKNCPNGDFSAASEARWEEVSDFDQNVS